MSVKSPLNAAKSLIDLPFTAQIDESDCGAACLVMTCQFLKKNISLAEARILCQNDITGQKLAEILNQLGMESSFVKKKFSSLSSLTMPVIAHWQGNHWVVLCGCKNNQLKIADPASGIYFLDIAEAEKNYSGYAIVIHSSKNVNYTTAKQETHLAPLLKPFRLALIFSTIIALPIFCVEVCIPLLFQKIIDGNFLEHEESVKWFLIFSSLATILVIICFASLNLILYHGAIKTEKNILNSLLNKWLKFPDNFYKERSFNELRSRLESLFEIKYFLVNGAGNGLFALMEIIALFAMLEFYGAALNFAFLLLPAFILVFYTFYIAKNNAGLLKYSRSSFINSLDDFTRGIFSIRTAATTEKFSELQTKFKNEMYDKVYPLERKILICEKGSQALAISAWILLIFQLCPKYLNQELSTGTLFAIIILSGLILAALARIVNKRDKFEHASLVYEYLNDLLNHQNLPENPPVIQENGSLKITDAYQNQVTLDKGSKTLLMGSDKQSLIDHLDKKSLSPFNLSITIEENNFSEMESFPQLALIHKNEHIFNMTVIENIAVGAPVDLTQIKWSLRLALADSVVENLPNGLDTRITQGMLQANEEKKLLLARLLYRQRPLTILQNLSAFMTSEELLIFAYHLQTQLPNKTILIDDEAPELLNGLNNKLTLEGERIRQFTT